VIAQLLTTKLVAPDFSPVAHFPSIGHFLEVHPEPAKARRTSINRTPIEIDFFCVIVLLRWTGATGDILSVSHAYLSLLPMASVLDAPSVAAGIAFNYSTFAGGAAREATGSLFLHRQWLPSPASACWVALFYFNFPLYQAFLLA
jgi:hypothetical protein